jgi:hypothetical protein
MDEKEMKGITPESTPLTDSMNPEMIEELSNGRGSEEEENKEG